MNGCPHCVHRGFQAKEDYGGEVCGVHKRRQKQLAGENLFDHCVYFIQGEHGGPIKIGRSASRESCKRRLKDLQCGSPVKLVIRAVRNDVSEDALHCRFASARLHGEWFEPTEEICALANTKQEAA